MYNNIPCTPCIRGGGDLSSEFSTSFVPRPPPRRRRHARYMHQRYANYHSRVPTNSIFIGLIVLSSGNDENAIALYIGSSMRAHRFHVTAVVVGPCREGECRSLQTSGNPSHILQVPTEYYRHNILCLLIQCYSIRLWGSNRYGHSNSNSSTKYNDTLLSHRFLDRLKIIIKILGSCHP